MSTFTDILPTLAHYLNLGDLVNVASTSIHCSYIIHCHLEERRAALSTKYSNHSGMLYQILRIHNTIVSKSHAIHILIPPATTSMSLLLVPVE